MMTPTFPTHPLMRKAVLCGALMLAAATASAQTYTKAQLQETYSAYLSTEGFRPEVTQAGNVRFRREGKNYVIYVDERDPTYFSIGLSFTVEDKSAAMRVRQLEGVNAASSNTKVIKGYLDSDGDLIFSAEMFLVVPGDFKTSMGRLLRAMDSAYDKYTAKVAEKR